MLNRRDLLKLFGAGAAAVVPIGIRKAITKVEGDEKKKLFEQITGGPNKSETPVEVVAANQPPASVKLSGGTTRIELQNCTITFRDGSGDTIEIALGEGNITWTKQCDYEYMIDRGQLDTARVTDYSLDVTMNCVFEWLRSSTEKYQTPMDMLRETQINELDLIVAVNDEAYIFTGFNWHTIEWDLSAAMMSISGICGICNTTQAARMT